MKLPFLRRALVQRKSPALSCSPRRKSRQIFQLEALESRQMLAVTANDDPDGGGAYQVTEDVPFTSTASQLVLVAAGASGWSYLDKITNGNNASPIEGYPTDAEGDAWHANAFNTATSTVGIGAWQTGTAIFGAGSIGPPNQTIITTLANNERATAGSGTNSATTYLFRKQFTVTAQFLASNPSYALNIIGDDGGILYVNGTEVLRHRIAAGAVSTTTFASNSPETWENNVPFNAGVTNATITSLLVAGTNTIAFELHQTTDTSSDSAFDMSLIANSGGGVLLNDVTSGAVGTPVLSVVTQPLHGSVVLGQDGNFTYTPAQNYSGSDSFVYLLADNVSNDTAAVNLQVNAVNDPPTATNDFYTTAEETTLTVNVASGGAASIPRNSTWSYLDKIENGLQTGGVIEGYPTDAEGDAWYTDNFNTATSTAAIGAWQTGAGIFAGPLDGLNFGAGTTFLDGIDDAANGSDNSVTTYLFRRTFNVTNAALITSLNIDLLSDDGGILYINGVEVLRHLMPVDPITTTTVATAIGDEGAYVPLVANVTGLLRNGSNTIAYELHQQSAGSSDVGFDLGLSTSSSAYGILNNDFDVEGDAITAITLIPQAGPTNGSVSLNQDGTFTYTPNPNFNGTDTFVYVITAGGQQSQFGVAFLTVTPSPDSPAPVNDTYSVDQLAVLNVTSADYSANQGVGAALFPGGSAWFYSANNSDQPTVNPTWKNPGFNPGAASGWNSTPGAAPLGFGEGDEATVLPSTTASTYYFQRTFNVVNPATSGRLVLAMVRDDGAAVYLNGVEISRQNLVAGATHGHTASAAADPENTVFYTLVDLASLPGGNPLVAGTNTIAVEVHQRFAPGDDLSFDLALSWALAPYGVGANDTDPDGDTLTPTHNLASGPAHAQSFTFNANGTFTYDPVNNYAGPDSFTYTSTDPSGRQTVATVNINVTAPNFSVVSTNPANNATLTVAPTTITVDFSAPVLASSVQASDLTLDGTPATAVATIDADTRQFTLPAGITAGLHNVAIAGGAIQSTVGGNLAAFNSQFTLLQPATVTNLSAIDVLNTTATIRAGVTATGFDNPALRLYWGDNDGGTNVALWDSFVDLGVQGVGSYSTGLTGLVSNRQYFYRARAVNAAGTSWAPSTANFTTTTGVAIDPRLNEFMAENTSTIADEDGQFNDWIEIHNPGTLPRDLTGYYLTDDSLVLNKWQFPATTIAPNSYLIVWASNKNRRIPSQPLHTNFRLESVGEFLGLVAPNGTTIVSQYAPTYPAQTANRSYGLQVGDLAPVFFSPSTPGAANLAGQVVINEVMYHPPSENVLDEWIELKNVGSAPANVNGWQFVRGVTYTLPNVSIPAGGYLVVAADAAQFTATNPTFTGTVVGGWTGQLSNRTENIELHSNLGQIIDRVEYADEGDWALRRPDVANGAGWTWIANHDGFGSTLELIQPLLSNNQGQNWTSSAAPGGTPGAANGAADGDIAPLITNIDHTPVVPRSIDTVKVTVDLADELAAGMSAQLWWRDASTDPPGPWQTQMMFDDGTNGDVTANNGKFTALIPPRANGTVIEFYIRAADLGGSVRFYPAPTDDFEGHGANLLYQVSDETPSTAQPMYRIVMTEADRVFFGNLNRGSNAGINATFVSTFGADASTTYLSELRYRGASSRGRNPPTMRLNLPSDDSFHGQVALNLNSQYTHSQLAGSAVFRMAGLQAPESTAVQLRINGLNIAGSDSPQFGSYVAMEVMNSDFAENAFPLDSGGNAYRGINHTAPLNFLGTNPNSYVNPYDKLTNASEADYRDVMRLTCELSRAEAPAITACPALDPLAPDISGSYDVNLVSQIVDIDQWVRHIAIHTLMANNETTLANGFGDDYAMYRGLVDPRFVLLPHDLDTILGQGDSPGGASDSIHRYAQLPSVGKLLSQPQVMHRYYTALIDLINTTFSPAVLDPLLDNVLGSFVPTATIDAMKAFAVARNAYVLTQIPTTFTVASGLPVQNGFPRSTAASTGSISGTADTRVTERVLVDNVPANYNPQTGVWGFGTFSNATIVPAGSKWKFLDDGTSQDGLGTYSPADATWFGSPLYDDGPATAWKQLDAPGNNGGEYGYGDGEGTLINCSPTGTCNNGTNYITSYFRQSFTVANPAQYTSLTLRLLRDDGAAVYLNGVDITTDLGLRNLPANPVFTTPASTSIGGSAESSFNDFTVNPALLVAGTNVLAVEMHQNNPSSSDVSFNLALLATTIDAVGGVTLTPGINRLLVQEMGAGAVEVARQFIDVWYDDGTVLDIGGPITENTTYTAANGPYRVTSNITVNPGMTLTIEPGTTLYFNPGVGIVVNSSAGVHGRLVAEGNELNHIRLRSILGTTTPWAGIRFVNTTADNRLAYVDMENGDSRGDSIESRFASLTLDHMTWVSASSQILDLDDSSFHVKNSIFPGIAAGGTDGELIHGNRILAGGRAIIENNIFGVTNGYNDVIDFTGGQRPGPIIQILNNVFTGGSDDGLDFDGTDAHIEGNIFKNFHKNNTSDSSSNAIATGVDGGNASEITVVRNFFYDNDHAVLVKEGSHLIFQHNTVVNSTIAAINFDEPNRPVQPGLGAIVEGSIFDQTTPTFENVYVSHPVEGTTQLSVNRSIVAAANVGLGVGNLPVSAGARINDPANDDFTLRAGSAAIATGPHLRDMGAKVAPWAVISGEPMPLTAATGATLTVGGAGITHYRFKLDNGAYGAERPVATPITLTGLAAGAHTVTVIGKNSAGIYQDTAGAAPTVSRSWTVQAGHVDVRINEILAVNNTALNHAGTFPDAIELYNYGTTLVTLTGMTLTDDVTQPGKYIFPPATTLAPGAFLTVYANNPDATPGLHTGFSLDRTGETVSIFTAPDGQLVDQVSFGTQIPDASIARNARNDWVLSTPTLGAANVARRLGDPALVKINEWLASTDVLFNDDLIELYNADAHPVALGGLYLTDEPVGYKAKHAIAPLSFVGTGTSPLSAGGNYALFVADDQQQNGLNHTNFNLSADQEMIGLFTPTQQPIDVVLYGPQKPDISLGRNGDANPLYTAYTPPNLGQTNPTGATTTPIYDLLDFLRVTEIHYNPPLGETTEFVELQNIGTVPLPLAGVRLTNGVDFTFPAMTLNPGQFVVVVENLAAFQARYGLGITVAGVYDGSFNNAGENVELKLAEPFDAAIQDFTYDDIWYPTTDGLGFSLVIRNPLGVLPNWSLATGWRASGLSGGSPGAADRPVVTVNTLATSDTTPPLTGTISDPLATIQVTVNGNTYTAVNNGDLTWSIPDNMIAPPLAINTYNVGVTATSVHGSGTDATTNELQITTTGGTPLAGLRISEIMYFPPAASGAAEAGFAADDFEYLEFHNILATPITLTGVQLVNAVTFTFPNMVLPAGDRTLVVRNQAAFNARYPYATTRVAGVYGGSLSNNGELVTLQDAAATQILNFNYDDIAPWPTNARGLGQSLVMISTTGPVGDWALAAKWRESHEVKGSPGEIDVILGDHNLDNRVSLVDLPTIQSRLGQPTGGGIFVGDLNRSGNVSRDDVVKWIANFGRSYTPPPPSPEAPSPAAAPSAAHDEAIAQSTSDTTPPLRTSTRRPVTSSDRTTRQHAIDQALVELPPPPNAPTKLRATRSPRPTPQPS